MTTTNDLSLESLAKRVKALDDVIATKEPEQSRKVWRRVVRGTAILHSVTN